MTLDPKALEAAMHDVKRFRFRTDSTIDDFVFMTAQAAITAYKRAREAQGLVEVSMNSTVDAALGSSFLAVWQQAAKNHQKYSATGSTESDISFLALGLAGEAGEVANFAKKRWRDGDEHHDDLRKEIADVLAYAFMLAYTLGIFPAELLNTLAQKQQVFIEKMEARAARPQKGE